MIVNRNLVLCAILVSAIAALGVTTITLTVLASQVLLQ
jgi:hypothetical protein